jgi:hypothetical protein
MEEDNMSVKRGVLVVLIACITMLASAGNPQIRARAQALPPPQGATPLGVTIPYPGRLSDEAGQPVADGLYDLAFALYEAEKSGEPLWMETEEGVTVQGSSFTALLGSTNPITQETLDDSERWLAVAVRGPGEAEFTALTPRQRLSAASSVGSVSAASGMTCAHDHWGETWEGAGTGLMLKDTVHGGSASLPGFESGVFGSSTYFDGVRGFSYDDGRGVYGHSIYGTGVRGSSSSSWGVEAEGGGDTSPYDKLGDLVLAGDRGEIFTFGQSLGLYSNGNAFVFLDDDNNDSNSAFKIFNGNDVVVHEIREDGTKSAIVQTASYGQRAVYTMESPEVWLEDFGTASLINGRATVTIEPIFAETANVEMDYHVFFAPLGDCKGLYVAAKTPVSFEVRELGGGTANVGFDYRIVAKRQGLESIRLEAPTGLAGHAGK